MTRMMWHALMQAPLALLFMLCRGVHVSHAKRCCQRAHHGLLDRTQSSPDSDAALGQGILCALCTLLSGMFCIHC